MFNPNMMNMGNLMNMLGGAANMQQQFNQFRGQLQGNPQQQAMQAQNIMQNAMNLGQINQNQLSQLFQIAQQFSQMMPR